MKILNRLVATLILSAGMTGGYSSDNSALKPHDDEALARAMAADKAATPRAQSDPNRPSYHILAPAGWINDPNGPIYHNGEWHMFYQHNPYGDGWGNMHWGHVRSRDLAHWEHLPIALWPSKEVGEDHVFSGCATIRKDGKPAILYTSIGRGKSATDYAEQWLALGDDQLIRWEKAAGNPALAPSIHGATQMWDWRDPFLFKYKGADYLVLGGNLNHGKGGEAVVNLYRATDDSLLKWEYLGVLFKHPDPKAVNIECPNFFELDGKWVLIVSPHRRVEYFVGNFDGKTFTPEKQGLMDESDNFYAPNCTTDDHGRRVLWGWVRGFKDGQGWNGCHTLPRVLTIVDGDLHQSPAPELKALRSREIPGSANTAFDSPQMEVHLAAPQKSSFSLSVSRTPNDPGLPVSYAEGTLKIGGQTVIEHSNKPLDLHVFRDHSVVEFYINGAKCVTKVQYPRDGKSTLELNTGERSKVTVTAYELSSAWNEPTASPQKNN